MNDAIDRAGRRQEAIGRLDAITSGVAIAGVAGTIGFGILAAATWSGNATAPTDAGGAVQPGNDLVPTQPQPDVDADDSQPFMAAPPPRSARGAGHATTGGSG